jgi:hypothetical protein
MSVFLMGSDLELLGVSQSNGIVHPKLKVYFWVYHRWEFGMEVFSKLGSSSE